MLGLTPTLIVTPKVLPYPSYICLYYPGGKLSPGLALIASTTQPLDYCIIIEYSSASGLRGKLEQFKLERGGGRVRRGG